MTRDTGSTRRRGSARRLALGALIALAVSLCARDARADDPDRSAMAEEWAEAVAELKSESPPPARADLAPAREPAVSLAPRTESDPRPETVASEPAQAELAPPSGAYGESTVEIPQAIGDPAATDAEVGPDAETNAEIERYQRAQNPPPPNVKSIREFIAHGIIRTPLGMEVKEGRRRLKSGEHAEGLLIMNVMPGSAADVAGLHPYRRTVHNLLAAATVAGALIFPPAILVLPVLDYSQVGESYDLIIGIDGIRVTNFLDFEDRLREVAPGQLVYLSIVRNGARLQVPVKMPDSATRVTY